MSRSRAWAFDVKVTYKGADQRGVVREWTAGERISGIGTGEMSEDEARVIAARLLDTNDRTRRYVLGKYPEGATATLGRGFLYEQHLSDPLD